jgi:Na+-transporting NADH:ubiquinone oxidoreductase subunit NqrC
MNRTNTIAVLIVVAAVIVCSVIVIPFDRITEEKTEEQASKDRIDNLYMTEEEFEEKEHKQFCSSYKEITRVGDLPVMCLKYFI